MSKAAIIGTGGIAEKHIEAMQGRVEIVAAVDIDAARVQAFCTKYAIPQFYTSADQMLTRDNPGLVVIATPPATHFDLIKSALQSGAWVLCEKPLVASLAEFDELERIQQQTGRYVGTIFQWRFGSGARHVKQQIESGVAGRVLVGVCQTLWYRDQAYYDVPWRGKWATELGGVSMNHGIHLMDLFLWLMGGQWMSVQAMMQTSDRDIEVEDISMAQVHFANGALGSIMNSVLSPRQESYVRLDLQRLTVELRGLYYADNANWRFSLAEDSPHADVLAAYEAIDGDFTGDHEAVLRDMLLAMQQNRPPLVSGGEGRRILEFLASLYKSALTGRSVLQGSITPDDPFYYAMNGD
jgi:predicted dehydrogenase